MSGLKFGRGAPHGYVRLPSRLCPHCFHTQPTRCHTPACSWIALRELCLCTKKMERRELPKSRKNKYWRKTKKLLKMAHEFPLAPGTACCVHHAPHQHKIVVTNKPCWSHQPRQRRQDPANLPLLGCWPQTPVLMCSSIIKITAGQHLSHNAMNTWHVRRNPI